MPRLSPPPVNTPIFDRKGQMVPVWQDFFTALTNEIRFSDLAGILSVIQGGTALGALSAHAVIIGAGTAPATFTGPGAVGTVLKGMGASADPVFAPLTSADIGDLASGIYTPALTLVANLSTATAFPCQYLRVGSVVSVSGRVDVDPVAALDTQLGISLPIASNFATVESCAGVGSSPGIAGQSMAVLGDVVNDRAVLQWKAVDVTLQASYFGFQYRVI